MNMTSATYLLQSAYTLGITKQVQTHEKWIATSFKLASIAGNAHLAATQQVGRLDLLLRQVENEKLEKMRRGPLSEVDFTLELQFSLSTSWLLRTYEIARAGKEQLKRLGEANPKLIALERRLAIARMPIAKGQIQGMDIAANKQNPPILVRVGDAVSTPYQPDGSYIVPSSICSNTGAIVWYPVDMKSRKTIAICRRDVSDALLAIFD